MGGYRVEVPPQLPRVIDAALMGFLRALRLTVQSLLVQPWLRTGSFNVLSDQSLAIGSNTISHGLGRAPAGVLVLKSNSALKVPGLTAGTDTTVVLTSSDTATVDLLFW